MPIIERLAQALDHNGVERLVIVAGYRAELIRDYLGESFGGIAIEYIVSPLFATTNTLYSLWLARDAVDEPFLLVESDVVFDEPLLAPLLRPDRIAVSRQLPWMNGTTVTLDASGMVERPLLTAPGRLRRALHRPDHFITVNITSLARDTWAEARERLDRHVAAGPYRLLPRCRLCGDGRRRQLGAFGRDLPGRGWYEVDTPADRDAAELVFP